MVRARVAEESKVEWGKGGGRSRERKWGRGRVEGGAFEREGR